MTVLKWVVFDVEGDSLTPTKMHCLSWKDQDGNKGTLVDYQDIRDFFTRYSVYIGHNIRRWDIPNLQRLVGISVDEIFIVDTLGLAWYLEPERRSHGLESYGEDFGVPKPKIDDWENQSLRDYVNRCETDVEINYRLWSRHYLYLLRLYPNKDDLWRFLRYLDFKLYCAHLQEESRWKFDRDYCNKVSLDLVAERDKKLEELRRAMPPVPVSRTVRPPAKLYRADGQLSVLGQRWQERLIERGLPLDYEGTLEEITGHVDPNPGSHTQIKDWLYSLGWVPQTIKYVRNKETGVIKEIPQINKEHGGGICDSIKLLYEKEPRLELLDGLSVLNHRIAILSGFLRDCSDDGYLTARIAGLTNTLRFKHAELVNLPKPEKPYGIYVRSCLIADDDFELCGSDMSGLEDRLKQHFLFPHDPEYVASLQSSDYDPHLDIAVLAGMMSNEDAIAYKGGDHSKKSIRSTAKNGNYALIGAYKIA